MRSLLLLLAAASLTGCSTPILRAASSGQNDEVAKLLEEGTSIEDKALNGCGFYPPNAQRAGNETPLICAAINGRVDTVKLLLKKGANVDAVDFLGRSALYYATTGVSADAAVAEVLRAKMEGRPLDAPAAPPPAAEPEAKPAVAAKPWWQQ